MKAKWPIGGDHTNSRFYEIEGEVQIAALLSKRLPGIELEDLEVLTDLVTERKSWIALHAGGCRRNTRGSAKSTLVLDKVTAAFQSARAIKPFKNLIGELEVTKQVVGGENEHEHPEIRQKAAEAMIRSSDSSCSSGANCS